MTSYPGTTVADVGFTNNTWVVLGVVVGDAANVNTCPASSFATEMGGGSAATWGEQYTKVSDAGTTHGTHQLNLNTTGAGRSRIACGDGVVVIGHTEYTMALDVNGTSVSIRSSEIVQVGGGTTVNGTMNTIATDGNGTWLIGSDGGGDGGEVAESTDNGANWTRILNDYTFGSGTTARKFEAIRANVYLPV